MASFRIEKRYFRKGVNYIAGVDEVGRGALFGPVVAAAVVFPPQFFSKSCPEWVAEVDDSKSLTPKKREELERRIIREALAVGIGTASVQEIARLNIHRASMLAMSRAVAQLRLIPELILIDGARLRLEEIPIYQLSLRGGDRASCSIAAASIVAKVFRDSLIMRLDRVFKGYDLCHNKGYGTKKHFQALRELGPTPLHRLSFNLKI